MRNEEKWQPTRVIKMPEGRFELNRLRIYGGSFHIAQRQWEVYQPVLSSQPKGSLLDIGCGPVPYYQVYRPLVDEVVCLDHPQGIHGVMHVDVPHDLNTEDQLPFPDERFDTVLATDMLPQMKRPELFMREVSRILKPGGKAIVSTTFVNWMGEYPNEYMHVSGPGLRSTAESAGLQMIHLESFGGHADVLLDTLNKFFPNGVGNRFFRVLAWAVNATGWPSRNRARTKDRYALGNIMVAMKPKP